MSVALSVPSSLTVTGTLTNSSIVSSMVRVDANGVLSTTTLQSNLSLSGGSTLSLATTLASINSVTSAALSNLVLTTASSSLNAITVTSATGALTLGQGVLSFTGATTITGGAGNMVLTAGTGNSRTLALQSTTSGGTATTAVLIDAAQNTLHSGMVGIGTGSTAPIAALQVIDTGTTNPRGIIHDQYNAGTNSSQFNARKARGTFTTPLAIVTGDVLARFIAWGHDGTQFIEAGNMRFTSSGTVGTSQVPSQFEVWTSTNASPSVLTQRLVIDSAGLSTFAAGVAATTAVLSSLTSGRVTFASTAGLLADSASLTYNSGTGALTATTFVGAVTSNTITSAAGQPLILATGTFGTSITLASATGIPTFATHVVLEGVTSTGATGTGNLVYSITPTLTGSPVVGGVTFTSSAATSLNTITSAAGQNLVLALGTGGTALTLTDTTKAATFAGALTAGLITTTGSTAGVLFVPRDSSGNNWTAYNNTGSFRLNNGSDKVTVNSTGDTSLASSTASTSTTTGSIVTAGGVGIGGDIYLGAAGTLYARYLQGNGATAWVDVKPGNNDLAFNTGAGLLTLKLSGGPAATITGGAGNMTLLAGTGASRTLTLQTTTSGSVAQSNLVLNADLSSTFGSTVTLASGGLQWVGSSNAITNSAGTFTITAGGNTAMSLQGAGTINIPLSAFTVSNSTASTSTTTGSIVTAGGVGVAGTGWFGSDVNATKSSAGTTTRFSALSSDTTSWSEMQVKNTGTSGRDFSLGTGGSGTGAVASKFYIWDNTSGGARLTIDSNGQLAVLPTTASTSSTTGSLVVSGGAGFAKDVWINSVRVGLGAGAISTNTVCGAGMGGSLTASSSINTLFGYQTGGSITDGSANTLGGAQCGDSISTGTTNTAFGSAALRGITTTSGNVALGASAGRYETGSNSFYVDNQDRTNTAGDKVGAILYGTFSATPSSQTLSVNARLTTNAGRFLKTSVITSNTTLDATSHVVVCNSATPFTVTLPSGATTGATFVLKNKGSATVTLAGGGANIFALAAAATIPLATGESLIVTYDGAVWAAI